MLNSLSAKRDETKEDYPADSTNISDDEHRIPSITDVFSEPAVDLEEGAEQSANEEQAQTGGAQQTESTANQQNEGMEATITVE